MEYEEMMNPSCTKEEWDAMNMEDKKKMYDACGGGKKKVMDSVSHTDTWEGFDLIPFRKTDEGYLIGEAIVTNIGVFTYRNPDGSTTRELRRREDVFAPESMLTLQNKPITDDHPNTDVSVENYKELSVGHTSSTVIRDSDYLATGLIFTDKNAVDEVIGGKRALSCGYTCNLVKADAGSMWLGVPYDYIQTDIRYNHVALVDKGRAGDEAVIRMDSAHTCNPFIKIIPKEDTMELKVVKLDGVDYSAEAKVIEAYTLAQTKADEAIKELDGIKAEKSKIEAERDQAMERADTLTAELDAIKQNHIDADKVAEMVKARVALEASATKIGVEVKDGMTDLEIKKAVILYKSPNAKLDGKDDVYIQARYDGVMEDVAVEEEKKADSASREVNAPAEKKDSVDVASADAKRKAMVEATRNAYMGKQK